jgi:hypothetical protein
MITLLQSYEKPPLISTSTPIPNAAATVALSGDQRGSSGGASRCGIGILGVCVGFLWFRLGIALFLPVLADST